MPDYRPPGWPNEAGTKQFHFDLGCRDIAATEARAVELGATVPDEQPGETWRVLLDPPATPSASPTPATGDGRSVVFAAAADLHDVH